MTGDLGAAAGEVHEKAEDVLDFWFGLPTERQFAKDEALDAEIRKRFGALRDTVLASGAAEWRDDPDTLLAAIILLDQFSRNVHRGRAEAFGGDTLARSLTLLAIGRGWEGRYPPERRAFLYLPLMHAEDAASQALSVDRYTELGLETNRRFAEDHAAVFTRFGRFPGRNVARGRLSTAEELAYLAEPGAGW